MTVVIVYMSNYEFQNSKVILSAFIFSLFTYSAAYTLNERLKQHLQASSAPLNEVHLIKKQIKDDRIFMTFSMTIATFVLFYE